MNKLDPLIIESILCESKENNFNNNFDYNYFLSLDLTIYHKFITKLFYYKTDKCKKYNLCLDGEYLDIDIFNIEPIISIDVDCLVNKDINLYTYDMYGKLIKREDYTVNDISKILGIIFD